MGVASENTHESAVDSGDATGGGRSKRTSTKGPGDRELLDGERREQQNVDQSVRANSWIHRGHRKRKRSQDIGILTSRMTRKMMIIG